MAKLRERVEKLERKEQEYSLIIYGDKNRNVKGILRLCEEYKKVLDEHSKYVQWVVAGGFVISVVWAMFVVYVKHLKGIL